jgi:acyl-CoA thioester hydrolase
MSRLKASFPIHIHFSEVDTLQIVWHGHYLKYFEYAREQFALKHGLDYLTAKSHGFALPITNTNTDYKLPLKYGDKASVLVEFLPQEASKIVYKYTIINQDDKVICKAETTQVFISVENNQLQFVFPAYFKNAVETLMSYE